MMSEVERVKLSEPETSSNETPLPAEPERNTGFVSGPQPLRPTTPLRTIPRPQSPIARPEPKPQPRFSRAMKVVQTVLPLVQRALPLLEGNVASAVANLLAPMPQSSQASLEPVERALRGVHAEIEQLHGNNKEQAAALVRLNDQLADLKDAADRQASYQHELADELYSLRKRLTVIAILGFVLLAASLGASIFLLLRSGQLFR
jgi:hypothetical protein